MTNVNTTTNGPTGGVPVKVNFNTDSPLSWGFDNGGFLFRASSAVTFNPTTLTGNGGTIPNATEAIQYPNPTLRFAYGTSIANLNDKTAAADQSFGLGNVTLLSIDPTFRAWEEGAERIAMNGLLYPNGDVITSPPALRSVPTSESEKIPKAELPVVKNRPVKEFHNPDKDIRITVSRSRAGTLKKAFRWSKAPAKVRKAARFKYKGARVTLVVPGMRKMDHHQVPWVTRVLGALEKKGVKPLRMTI